MQYIKLLSVIFFCSILGCKSRESKQTETERTFINHDSVEVIATWKGDSVITKEGNYFQFVFLDSNTYKIAWGNRMKSYISNKTFELISKGLLLNQSSQDAILLSQSCGTSCTHAVVLMLNSDSLREYTTLRASNIEKKLVAYIPIESNSLIVIENFETRKSIVLDNVELCPAAFQGDCIDSLGFSENRFFIKWQGNKWTSKKKDTREKTINVSSLITK